MAERLRWVMETVGHDGFKFGLDEVTPVSWRIRHTRKVNEKAYRYLELPRPVCQPRYEEWLREHNGKVLTGSIAGIRETVLDLRKGSVCQ